jgi:hypothetical protein
LYDMKRMIDSIQQYAEPFQAKYKIVKETL